MVPTYACTNPFQPMRLVSSILLVVSLSSLALNAQNQFDEEQRSVETVFYAFYEAISDKDSTAVKSIIYKPKGLQRFWHFFTGSENGLISQGSSSVRGFIKSVGSVGSLYGKCNYDFDKITIRVYHRYATVNANYKCNLADDSFDHSGTYTLHLLKPDDWKVERVIRYINVADKKTP